GGGASPGELAGERRGGGGAPPGDQHVAGARPQRQQARVVLDQGGGAVGGALRGGQVRGRSHDPVDLGGVGVGVAEQAAPVLELQDPVHRLVEAAFGQFPGPDGVDDGGELAGEQAVAVVVGRGFEEHVDAGLEGQDGDAFVAVLGADAVDGEGVGGGDAAVAEASAREAGEDGPRQGGGVAGGVQRRHHDVRGHDRVDAGGDGGAERGQVEPFP